MKTSDKLKGHLSIAAAYTIFGLNLVFCKDIANSQTVSPYVLFTLRAIGASVLFWLLSMLMPREKVLMAITMTSAIDTAIIGTLGPIFTMFFAFFFLGEPITGKKAGGVALSFVGILLLIFNSVQSGGAAATSPWGVILLLVNSLSFSLYLGLFRPLISKYSVITFMKWSFLFSLLLSLPISARGLVTTDFAAIPVNVRWEIGYLILFATFFAYFLIPYGQKFIRPTLVSMYSYVQPIIAAVVSIWAGVDTLSWQKVLASALVVGGVVLVSRSRAAASVGSKGRFS